MVWSEYAFYGSLAMIVVWDVCVMVGVIEVAWSWDYHIPIVASALMALSMFRSLKCVQHRVNEIISTN